MIAKYDYWLEPGNIIRIEGWAKDGLSDKQIAHNMDIAQSTYYVWKKKFVEISDALKKGKDTVDREVENALHKSATGYWVTEEKTFIEDAGGKQKKKVERTKKWVAPSPTAQIYWLKNRKPDVWNERTHVEDVSQEDKIGELLDKVVAKTDDLI